MNKLGDETIAAMYLADLETAGGLSPAWVGRAFIPTYNRLSLFIMCLPMLMLANYSKEFRVDFVKFISQPIPRVWVLAAISFIGMLFSIVNVFTRGPKPNYQKWFMLMFAIWVNCFTAFAAGLYIINNTPNTFLWVFPIWNMANALILLVLFRCRQLTTSDISDEDVSMLQLLIGMLIAIVVFLFCNYVFKFYWAITYSVCVVYATGFSRAVQQLLCPTTRQIDKLD